MRSISAALALCLISFNAQSAHAQTEDEAARAAALRESQIPAAGTTVSLIVYGEDPCPLGTGGEIVVCARRPESERYRIPPKLRQTAEVYGSQGWGSRVATVESDSRQFVPGSCNAIGSFGQTGCTAALLQQWFAERRIDQQTKALVP